MDQDVGVPLKKGSLHAAYGFSAHGCVRRVFGAAGAALAKRNVDSAA